MSTIAAISTPEAVGGISIIRISGSKALQIAERIFMPAGKKINQMQGYTCAFGSICDNGEVIDEGILTVFRTPKSYTGEDVVEISCHGGLFVTKKVLRLTLMYGAEPAGPGEFTKRAFLNGKITLAKAEAVMDIISADNQNELRSAVSLHDNTAYKKILHIKDELVAISAELAVWADYPDEDISSVNTADLLIKLKDEHQALLEINKAYDYGILMKQGILTAIAGKPNVGKSSLMNCLSRTQRSIVTNVAGTTRDIIEEVIILGRFKLRLLDMAGLHNTSDPVENIGIELAYKKINEASLILAVFDSSMPLSLEDMELIEKLHGKNAVAILNKSDLPFEINKNIFAEHFKYTVEVSAKDSTGIQELENCIQDIFTNNVIEEQCGIISNERQKKCLCNSISAVESCIEALVQGEFFDAITVLLDEAISFLLELSGERITDVIVNEIFSRFCIGK